MKSKSFDLVRFRKTPIQNFAKKNSFEQSWVRAYANSRFALLRILCNPAVFLSQEILS
jgi:hypothetical protein